MTQEKRKNNKDFAGLFIPGGLIIGMGFGFLYNNLTAGLFIGLGAGFLAFALIGIIKK